MLTHQEAALTVFTSLGKALPETSLISSTNTPSYLLIIYRQSTHQHDGAAYLTEGLHHFTIPRFLLTKHLHVEVSDFHALPRVMAALTDTQEAAAAMMLATA